jgi:hypothetical protein
LERLGWLVPTSGPLVIEVRIISAADGLIVYRIRSTWDDDPNSPLPSNTTRSNSGRRAAVRPRDIDDIGEFPALDVMMD